MFSLRLPRPSTESLDRPRSVALKPWIRLGEPLPLARSNTRIGITAPAAWSLASCTWLGSVVRYHSSGSYYACYFEKPVFCELCSRTFSAFFGKGFDIVIVSFFEIDATEF